MFFDAGCDFAQAVVCGFGLSGCGAELCGELDGLLCGFVVDGDGFGEEFDLLAEEGVDVIADMLGEDFWIEGAAGCFKA